MSGNVKKEKICVCQKPRKKKGPYPYENSSAMPNYHT